MHKRRLASISMNCVAQFRCARYQVNLLDGHGKLKNIVVRSDWLKAQCVTYINFVIGCFSVKLRVKTKVNKRRCGWHKDVFILRFFWLVDHRGTTLSDLTKRRRPTGPTCKSKLCPAPTICQRSHVVYLATCELRGSKYVGMTVRQLHARALEPLRAANGRKERTAFGDHYRAVHEKKDKATLSFEIVKQQHDDLRLHIEEALAIKTLRPDLNKRQEEIGTGFLP